MKNVGSVAISNRASRYLNIALAAAVAIQVCLYVNQTGGGQFFKLDPLVEDGFYLVSLFLLIGVVFTRYIYHTKLARKAEAGKDQAAAMTSMFSGVKHKLNNDMQVVLGNAELAEILVNNGGDLAKPVHNITAAANDAVERIEQLSVFGSTGFATLKPVDLNAMFRESMAKLNEELPSIVTLRLELDHLSAQVVADRHLLSLSLTHLIRLAVVSMRHGGEIVIRTSEFDGRKTGDSAAIAARVYIVRTLGQSREVEHVASPYVSRMRNLESDDIEQFQNGLKTTKALVERSGVKNVSLSRSGDESLFSMQFVTEMQSNPLKKDILVTQLYS
ncbi:MAG: hypothetical protein AB8B64_20595 [Granulosicoccus sp.]